ncbi:hypothetical protein Lal_00014537 [Lupinus albus]|nr:hypothetical protein Lal_00014537 [Lupinus albus]
MGNTGPLHPINPEIDRTYHKLVRQSRNLPFHSVTETDSDSFSMHSVQYTDFVHFVALCDSEHFEHSENSTHSENMAQPPTPPGPRERTLRELAAPDFTYDSSSIQYLNDDVPYVLKTGLIHLLPNTSWGDLKRIFLGKLFPPYRTTQSEKMFLGLGNNMEIVYMSIGRDSKGCVQAAPSSDFRATPTPIFL